jgi:uncharacterized protein YprB with RNaseH-like and TPR domain
VTDSLRPGVLGRRLRYLGSPQQDGPARQTLPAGQRATAAALRGWERAGKLTWRRRLFLDSPLDGEGLSELLLPAGYVPEELLFFDTETTGLSGGAGNYVFLFGSACLEGPRLACEQLFLADFPGEPEFLGLLAERLARHRLFVSYNGRAFDAPLLATRFVMNRMPFGLERQEDLLHWARRLWRRYLPDCSLGTVEREILGVERTEDVPGWEVPLIYLRYLATGGDEDLSAVMEHNLQDVVSLARLCGHVNRLLRREQLPRSTDGAALGTYLLKAGNDRGETMLAGSFGDGDRRAGRALSLHYKRLGRWREAVKVWEAMAGEEDLFAALELAKYHEHRAKDARTALEWVTRIASWEPVLSHSERYELERRRARLVRKCRSRGSGARPAGADSGTGDNAPGAGDASDGPGGGPGGPADGGAGDNVPGAGGPADAGASDGAATDGAAAGARAGGTDTGGHDPGGVGPPEGFSQRLRAFLDLDRRRRGRSDPGGSPPTDRSS